MQAPCMMNGALYIHNTRPFRPLDRPRAPPWPHEPPMCACPSRRSELDLAPHLTYHAHVAPGFSCHGMSETVPIDTSDRSYGATALSELRVLTVSVDLVCDAHEIGLGKRWWGVGLGWVGYYNHEVLWCTSPVLTGTLATDTRLPSFPKVMKVSNRSVGSA